MKGAWSARWGNWVVGLRVCDGKWAAKVWRWQPGESLAARSEINTQDGFDTQKDAVTWACGVMREDGAVVMILDAPSIVLENMLRFQPAPELCA